MADYFERLPREKWRPVRNLWKRGYDTARIAKLLKVREASVFNTLPDALREMELVDCGERL